MSERPASPRERFARTAEGTGETVGEAKWAALRELERRFPALDKAAVRFTVVSEGERGLLGVGYAPARVIASAADAEGEPEPLSAREPAHPAGSPAARVERLLERICADLGVSATVTVSDEEEAIVARVSGPDLGLLIGRHGQTIDAIQYLVNAIVWRDEDPRRDVVVDAAGYRDRRESALRRTAERAARDALRSGGAVALEPMSASDRKTVHRALSERTDVETASEGAEPTRHVVVRPSMAAEGEDGEDALA